jgi:hypothetical protein
VRAVQRALDPLSVRFAADHLVRDPLDHLEHVGFEIDSVQRSKRGLVERVLAHKPGGDAATARPIPNLAQQLGAARHR